MAEMNAGSPAGLTSPLAAARADRPPRLPLVVHALAVVLLVGALIYLGIAYVLMLLFAGILVAVLLRSLADFVGRKTGLPPGWSLGAVTLGLVLLAAGGIWIGAPKIGAEVGQLAEKLPKAFEQAKGYLSQFPWAKAMLDNGDPGKLLGGVGGGGGGFVGRVGGVLSRTVGIVVDIVVIVFVGLYLAIEPGHYVRGFVALLPHHRRLRGADALREAGKTLRLWMIGQGIDMLIIGALTTIGLWIIGVPLAITLGIITALFNFIPNFGPLVGFIPAVLLALGDSPDKALWVLILWFVAQSLEGYLITPLIQRKMIRMPEAMTLVSQVLLGVLLGAMGVALAAPLTAVAIVLVKVLYVQDTLGEQTQVPSDVEQGQEKAAEPPRSAAG